MLKKGLLGDEGACLFRFNMFSSNDLGELFDEHGFDDFSKDDMLVIPVQQLVAAQLQINKHKKALKSFLQKYGRKAPISGGSKVIVSSSKMQAVLHQSVAISQRARPQLHISKTLRSSVQQDVNMPSAGINSILMKRMQLKKKPINKEVTKSTGIRGDAVLVASCESHVMDGDNSIEELASMNSVSFGAFHTDCIWVSQTHDLERELSELKVSFQQQHMDESASVDAFVKEIEKNQLLLTATTAEEVKCRRAVSNMLEELANLRAMVKTLDASKNSEIERLQLQFENTMSMKNAELRSKILQLDSFDDSLRALQASSKFGELHARSATGFSLNILLQSLRNASNYECLHQQSVGETLVPTVPPVSSHFLDARRECLQDSILQPEIAVVAADSTGPLSNQWEAQANEASAVTVSAESAADAVFQSDARVSFASGKILRNGKQAGTDVGRV
jgi:hypothetical protein